MSPSGNPPATGDSGVCTQCLNHSRIIAKVTTIYIIAHRQVSLSKVSTNMPVDDGKWGDIKGYSREVIYV